MGSKIPGLRIPLRSCLCLWNIPCSVFQPVFLLSSLKKIPPVPTSQVLENTKIQQLMGIFILPLFIQSWKRSFFSHEAWKDTSVQGRASETRYGHGMMVDSWDSSSGRGRAACSPGSAPRWGWNWIPLERQERAAGGNSLLFPFRAEDQFSTAKKSRNVCVCRQGKALVQIVVLEKLPLLSSQVRG